MESTQQTLITSAQEIIYFYKYYEDCIFSSVFMWKLLYAIGMCHSHNLLEFSLYFRKTLYFAKQFKFDEEHLYVWSISWFLSFTYHSSILSFIAAEITIFFKGIWLLQSDTGTHEVLKNSLQINLTSLPARAMQKV